MGTGSDTMIIAMFAIICVGLLALIVVSIVRRIQFFYDELQKINVEISRTTGAERQRWKEEKKRVWRLLLPTYPRNR